MKPKLTVSWRRLSPFTWIVRHTIPRRDGIPLQVQLHIEDLLDEGCDENFIFEKINEELEEYNKI